jgi:hypothetical protein
MSGHDDYRQKAETCIALAELTRSPEERASLLQIAQGYLKLADMVAKRREDATARREAEPRPENDS